MPGWQRIAARTVGIVFYCLLIAIPLTGWLAHSLDAVSSPFFINPVFFGLMPMPILPVNSFGLSPLLRELGLSGIHELTSNLMTGLVILHTGAALKHHFVDRDDILMRMLPRIGCKTRVETE